MKVLLSQAIDDYVPSIRTNGNWKEQYLMNTVDGVGFHI